MLDVARGEYPFERGEDETFLTRSDGFHTVAFKIPEEGAFSRKCRAPIDSMLVAHYVEEMSRPIGVGFHPITGVSMFAQEVLDSVRSECPDPQVIKRLFPRDLDRAFERDRDRIMSGLYASVLESCKGMVALASGTAAAMAAVEHAENCLGNSSTGQLDHRRLGDLALDMHQRLGDKLREAPSAGSGEYASDCLKKSASLLLSIYKSPLTGKMYPSLPSRLEEIATAVPVTSLTSSPHSGPTARTPIKQTAEDKVR